ncbi:hypothetical protein [Eikenella sp. Marseille-P7795]|uniref:hypothetical protein n=1 Tax=Eikenella sp. Marseille-P7795 TaxID=2866577 RepID=UPI001CE41B88|nr:hypothetical protein [Eikenella sp. Marseille-P7795]
MPANIIGIPGSSGCTAPAKPASSNTSANTTNKAVIPAPKQNNDSPPQNKAAPADLKPARFCPPAAQGIMPPQQSAAAPSAAPF